MSALLPSAVARSHHLPRPATKVHNAASQQNHRGETPMADRFAVITGAGSGIGRASALALMNDGWSVALAGRRKEMLEETAGMKTGGRALVVPTDVTDPAQVDSAVRADQIEIRPPRHAVQQRRRRHAHHQFRRLHLRDVAAGRRGEPDAMFLCANAAFRMMRDQSPQRRTDHQQRLDLGACAAGRVPSPIPRPSTG